MMIIILMMIISDQSEADSEWFWLHSLLLSGEIENELLALVGLYLTSSLYRVLYTESILFSSSTDNELSLPKSQSEAMIFTQGHDRGFQQKVAVLPKDQWDWQT